MVIHTILFLWNHTLVCEKATFRINFEAQEEPESEKLTQLNQLKNGGGSFF